MHGIKRARIPHTTSVELEAQQKEERKIAEYKAAMEQFMSHKTSKNYDQDALDASSTVLMLNPEFQTGWAIRRDILTELLKNKTTEEQQSRYQHELAFSNQAVKKSPKDYSVWEYRKWLLATMPEADWNQEMLMVESVLQKDARNFHGWDYRRYLTKSITSLPSNKLENRQNPLQIPTTESELIYTEKKISENFSNFSAWHYRSKLLSHLPTFDKKKELELVKNACWSDPNDQSAWLYQRWLIGDGTIEVLDEQITWINELWEEEPDSRWCLESIVHYKKLKRRLVKSDLERERLGDECIDHLQKLQKIDILRTNRYRDLLREFVPAQR